MRKIFLFSMLGFFLFGFSFAQQSPSRHALGIGGGVVFLSDDSVLKPGLHFDYEYDLLAEKIDLSIGFASELVMADRRHIGLSVFLGFSPLKRLSVNLGPGVMFEGPETYFCSHVGIGYNWDFSNFSIGPYAEWAYTGKHYHLSFGMGLGYKF